ncbi:MAG: PAS domain S-box protein [Ferruginibacter sp.]
MKKNKNYFPFPSLIKNDLTHYTLHSRDAKYSGIVENSVHSFFLMGMGGEMLESNQAATSMFGYSPDEFRTLKRWNIIDHHDPNLLAAIQDCENSGFAITEARGIKKNGEIFPVEITATFFKDCKGGGNICCMVSDLSIHKKTEAAMRLSKERYDLVIKATKDLVWDWDLVTGEIYRNDSSLFDVYGLRSNEAIKNIGDWSNFIHPLDKEKITALIDHYVNSAEENDFVFEYRFRKADGTYAYISDKGYIIRNARGKAIRMIGAAENITERKQTELAIEESEQRYKNFLELSTEGIWRIELKEAMDITAPLEELIEHCFSSAYIAECNDAYAQMYGFREAVELIGIPINKLWPIENAVTIKYITGFIKNGFKATEEISYEYNRNGEQVIFINTMVGIVDGDFLRRVWGTRRDITDQVRTEKALAESENNLRTIIQTNPECIKLIDKEGTLLEMNPAGLAMIQADSLDQVVGNSLVKLVVPAYREAFKRLIQDVFKGNEAELQFEITGLKGRHCYLDTHGVPLRDEKNNIIALLAVTRDITEKIQLENSLNEERQIRQQQITGAVIAGQEKERTEIGEELHDNINQILASTKLYIECSLKDTEPRRDLIIESKLLLEKAMKEIRALSKSLLPPSLGEIGLKQALHELIGNIKQVNEPAISIEWNDTLENDINAKLKLTIFRIVQEQLSNVIKHANAKNIIISIKKEDGHIQLGVKDDGQGFDTSVKRVGVGLRNISSRAEVNNGSVCIVSAPGEGCELIVTFSD